MVCRIHLPIFAVRLIFPNIQAAYTLKGWLYVLLGKGYKSALYLWGKRLKSGEFNQCLTKLRSKPFSVCTILLSYN